MPNQDSATVHRRIPDVEDYIDILRRHKSWILGPLLAGLVVGVVTAYMWPDTYASDATIRVVPPQVPERYVPANVNAQMSERFNAMAASILSRSTLSTIITTYNLYPEERAKKSIEDVIEVNMRKDLDIIPVNSGAAGRRNAIAFRVSFRYRDRFQAHKVTEDVVTRIIDENVRSRSSQATQTTDFLQDKAEQAKKTLDDIDRRITEFRVRNIGQTPDQKSVNLQQLHSAELRIASQHSAISRVNQEKMMLEGELRTLQEKLKALSVIPTPAQVAAAQGPDATASVDREITQMETVVIPALLERYRETHPEVTRAQAALGLLRKRREALLAKQQSVEKPTAAPQPGRATPAQTRELLDLQGQIARVQRAIQGKDYEVEEINKEIAALNRSTKQYQARLETSPANEQQYMQLMLERQSASDQYEDLRNKMNSSQIATDLENRRQGETLELLDPASLPQTPSEPTRMHFVLGGLIAGLVVGALMVGAREVKDTSLKNLKDVRAYTQLMILGSIPLLENDLVVRRRRRLTWLAWSVATTLSLIIMAGSIY